jgi:hypothetical protein
MTKTAGSYSAIESVEIAYAWTVAQVKGKGIRRSKGERLLTGGRGFDSPDFDGGARDLRKK